MKTRTLMVGLLLIALVAVPLAIAAPEDDSPRGNQRGAREGGPRGMMGQGDLAQMLLGRMGEELGLTEAQKEKIQSIVETNKEKTQQTRQAVREKMQALNDAADEGDTDKITAAGKAAGEALTQQALQRAAIAKEVKAVLTAEQLT